MEIVTRRLRLRPPDDGDVAPLAALFADPRARRHLAVGPLCEPDAARTLAARFVACGRAEFDTAGTGTMAVERRRGGATPIGFCGLRPLPGAPDGLELVYALMPHAWGRGFATEAVGGCLAWGFASLPLRRVMALSAPDNLASRRVLEKSGLRHVGHSTRYYGRSLYLYLMTRTDWELVPALSPPPPPPGWLAAAPPPGKGFPRASR